MDMQEKRLFTVHEPDAGPRILIPSDTATREWLGSLVPSSHVKMQVTAPRRSLDQNALVHAVQQEIQKQCEWDKQEVERYCKLVHGVPILCRDDKTFSDRWEQIGVPMDYELQMELMAWLPVTRLMTKKQMTEYIDAMVMDFSRQGYVICLPGDAYGN